MSVGETSGTTALAALSDGLATAVETAGASVVRVDARRRQAASGVAWSADGIVVTADHVLERDEDVKVGLPDGRTVAATVVGRDPGSDVAVLRADATGLTPIGRGAAPRAGQLALVVARPYGGVMTSLGVVSAVGGPIRTMRGRLDSLVWTDAMFYPGFSGAPLIDAGGSAIGIATSRFGGGQGTGAAIPLDVVERVVGALLSHGRVKRGFLGIGSQPVALPAGLAQTLGRGERASALLVVSVEPNGPAERAGFIIGDLLVDLDGQPVSDTDDLRDLLGPERVGKAATARVLRGGEPRELSVTIGERA
jgi:S1-C subfamily serine protease